MSAAGKAAGSGGGITGALKGIGAGGAILGGLDYAEGRGFDRAQGAIDEAVTGLQQAAASAGDVLRGIFGCLPWQSSCDPSQIAPIGGNVTNATTVFFVDVLSVVL